MGYSKISSNDAARAARTGAVAGTSPCNLAAAQMLQCFSCCGLTVCEHTASVVTRSRRVSDRVTNFTVICS